ncbi:hypothetical protein, partial [Burkholderia pseudomallei]
SLSSAQDHEHDISNAPLATPVYTVSNFNSLLAARHASSTPGSRALDRREPNLAGSLVAQVAPIDCSHAYRRRRSMLLHACPARLRHPARNIEASPATIATIAADEERDAHGSGAHSDQERK